MIVVHTFTFTEKKKKGNTKIFTEYDEKKWKTKG